MHEKRKKKLTEGQKQCLRLVAAHMTSKEIARELDISPFTVDQRLDAARQKLGAASRKEAALKFAAIEGGELSDRFVYEPQPIADRGNPAIQSVPTSDRGHSLVQGGVADSVYVAGETGTHASALNTLFSIIRVPPIGGEQHEHSFKEVLLQSLNIAFYASLMIGIITIVLTVAMAAFD